MALNKGFQKAPLAEVYKGFLLLMEEIDNPSVAQTAKGVRISVLSDSIRLYVYRDEHGEITALYFRYFAYKWNS